MFYVYILKSDPSPTRGAESQGEVAYFYVGCTSDLRRRLAEHNRGDSAHTAKDLPWRLINYFAFLSRSKAEKFERYLKSRAGRRFQLQHFGE
jgi:predicted GIY-YIG superfamily endonuclease